MTIGLILLWTVPGFLVGAYVTYAKLVPFLTQRFVNTALVHDVYAERGRIVIVYALSDTPNRIRHVILNATEEALLTVEDEGTPELPT